MHKIMNSSYSRPFIQILQLSTVAVFWGRAWQHLFWDAPYRNLFWDQFLLKGIVEGWFGMEWSDYVTSPVVDSRIQLAIVLSGVFYIICGLAALLIHRLPHILQNLLLWGAGLLIFLAILYWKGKFHHWGQLFEYSLQFGSPIFLWLAVREKLQPVRLVKLMAIAVGITFFCHGLYAYGFYPRPENFTSMIMASLGVSEPFANQMLVVAGVVDFIAAASLIFLPLRWNVWVLAYCVMWGFLTGLARPWANFYPEFWEESLHQWVHTFVFRFPHFLIPLAAFIWLKFRPSEASLR
ncbi:MAG: hypothetical protein GYB31_19605 [Bacteroidetes bacterium]|nr:hypothetical protein [Bacteroidota bacterium]